MKPAPHYRPQIRFGRAATAALAIATAAAALVAPTPAQGQEYDTVSGNREKSAVAGDRAALAAYGLDLATLDQVKDTALLWRAVRELVLPGRVSEATQRRILRRVWLVDPETANGSRVASEWN